MSGQGNLNNVLDISTYQKFQEGICVAVTVVIDAVTAVCNLCHARFQQMRKMLQGSLDRRFLIQMRTCHVFSRLSFWLFGFTFLVVAGLSVVISVSVMFCDAQSSYKDLFLDFFDFKSSLQKGLAIQDYTLDAPVVPMVGELRLGERCEVDIVTFVDSSIRNGRRQVLSKSTFSAIPTRSWQKRIIRSFGGHGNGETDRGERKWGNVKDSFLTQFLNCRLLPGQGPSRWHVSSDMMSKWWISNSFDFEFLLCMCHMFSEIFVIFSFAKHFSGWISPSTACAITSICENDRMMHLWLFPGSWLVERGVHVGSGFAAFWFCVCTGLLSHLGTLSGFWFCLGCRHPPIWSKIFDYGANLNGQSQRRGHSNLSSMDLWTAKMLQLHFMRSHVLNFLIWVLFFNKKHQ